MHFIGDQLVQSDTLKEEKNKSTQSMLIHVLIWSFTMLPFALVIGMMDNGKVGLWGGWLLTVTILHFLIEWPISRQTTHLWYSRYIHKTAFWMHLEHLLTTVMLMLTFVYFNSL